MEKKQWIDLRANTVFSQTIWEYLMIVMTLWC
jgi:hypothetical protein